MLAELAAANAAFGIIKNFVSNGKELSGCVKQISDFVFSKEQLEKKTDKRKRRRTQEDNDLSRKTRTLARLAKIPSRG
jgi:hypothetical protein